MGIASYGRIACVYVQLVECCSFRRTPSSPSNALTSSSKTLVQVEAIGILKYIFTFFLRRRRYNSSQHCYHFTRAAQRRKKCSLVARRLDASHRVGRPNVFESWRESRRANAVHLADLCVNRFEIYFLCFDATSIAADHVLQNIWFCSKQYLKILANLGCPLFRKPAILYGPPHSS